MGGTHGGCHPEFLWVFYDVGFCGGIDPTATGSVDVFFIFLSNHAAVFFATANLVTGVQNFPQSSGTIVGILKVGASICSLGTPFYYYLPFTV